MILQALMQLQGDIACGTFTLNLVACPLFVRYMWSLGNAGSVHSLNRADEVTETCGTTRTILPIQGFALQLHFSCCYCSTSIKQLSLSAAQGSYLD